MTAGRMVYLVVIGLLLYLSWTINGGLDLINFFSATALVLAIVSLGYFIITLVKGENDRSYHAEQLAFITVNVVLIMAFFLWGFLIK